MYAFAQINEAISIADSSKPKVELEVPNNTEQNSNEQEEDQFDPLEHGPETALFW